MAELNKKLRVLLKPTYFILTFLWLSQSVAQNSISKVFLSSEVRKLHIQADVIQVQMLGESNNDKILVSLTRSAGSSKSSLTADGDMAFEQVGEELKIYHRSQLDKEDLQKRWMNPKAHSPHYILKISSPSMPLRIDSKWGQISIHQWNSTIEIVNQNGRVQFQNSNSSEARIMVMNGEVFVNQCKGQLNLETYTANSTIQQFEGKLNVNSFSGHHRVMKSNGRFTIHQSIGKLELNDNQSEVDFDIGAASLFADKLTGDLRGKSQSGPLRIHLSSNVNLRLSSVEAPVSIISNAMALNVNLGSKKGDISAPNYLKSQQWSQLKTVSGQLRGSLGKGLVFVRTESGPIQLR